MNLGAVRRSRGQGLGACCSSNGHYRCANGGATTVASCLKAEAWGMRSGVGASPIDNRRCMRDLLSSAHRMAASNGGADIARLIIIRCTSCSSRNSYREPQHADAREKRVLLRRASDRTCASTRVNREERVSTARSHPYTLPRLFALPDVRVGPTRTQVRKATDNTIIPHERHERTRVSNARGQYARIELRSITNIVRRRLSSVLGVFTSVAVR